MKQANLLAVHQQQPLAARWFSLATYCLESGCNIVTYAPDAFRAEVGDAEVESRLAGYFEASLQADGSAHWTWAWTDDAAPAGAALSRDDGRSESWSRVLPDWRERAFAG
jgi:hypothetical protein